MKFSSLPFAAIVLAIAVTGTWANTIDALVMELKSGDDAQRVHARQMLPRHGVDALPALLPLINDESEQVWRAAYNVVADIVNEASAPGHDLDRQRATDLLMTWLAPEQTPRAHEYSLRLLPYIVPQGYPVDSIVPFLNDDALREYARGALEIIASDEARLALENALQAAVGAHKVPFLVSLEHIGSPASLSSMTAAMDDPDPSVKAAAARAAARFARPELAPKYLSLLAGAPPDTAFEATDAVLRYADALARSGGNWTLAMKTYISVLETTNDPVLVSGALMGLGRFGDENVVPVLVTKAAESASREVQGALPLALASLNGKAATEAIIAHYADIPQPARPAVLRSLARGGHPGVVALIRGALADQDPAYRNAALNAAVSMGSAELLAPLMNLAERGDDSERPEAVRAALAIASSGTASDAAAEAGAALLKLYAYAEDDSARNGILMALARNPNTEALPLAMEAVKTPELNNAATSVLVALVPVLVAAGNHAGAHDIVAAVLQSGGSAQDVVAMAAGLGASADELGLPKMLGVLQHWHLIGPFTWTDDDDWERPFVNEPNVDLGAQVNGNAWNEVSIADPLGVVNLMAHFGTLTRVFAYAYTTVESPTAQNAQLRMGSDDGIVAWVNGDKVWENRVDRGLRVDEDVAAIALQPGVNTIVLKISQGGGGWNFCARITDESGMGIARE